MNVVRAIYGYIQYVLLWYDLYADTLKYMGIEINPYDKCIANKANQRNQHTIGWYVNNSNISHKEEKYVDDMFTIFKEKFRDLTITRGNSHEFLGMDLTITKEKRSDISMRKQIKEAVEMFGEEIK